jgi:lipopolysaccharide biosynthesis regulator YciM
LWRPPLEFTDLIALLLPVAAASGWIAARRRESKLKDAAGRSPLTQAYRRGINYLLDDKPEKAIETVDQILAQDSESQEMRIALGNHFRRRGDVERAIEIHSRLHQESAMSDGDRARADFELALDFMSAGLYDRAETLFLALESTPSHGKSALQQLLLLYQQQRDWHHAIECIVTLRRTMKPKHGETAAHFLCELADESMSLHRLKDARDYLSQALDDDPKSVRATLLKGKLEYSNGEYRQALDSFRSIESQNPIFLSVVLPLIGHCADRLGQERELMDYLDYLYETYHIVAAAIERASRLSKHQGYPAAVDYLMPILDESPDPQAVAHAIGLLAGDGLSHSGRLQRLAALLKDGLEGRQKFCCERCGFGTVELHWRCPSCRYWGAVRPTGPFSSLVFIDVDDGHHV